MGRNSKKNKGRKPAADQGLKGAASLASPSANVATAPSRPARTAKHKVRKFPTPATSTQANDSRTVRGLKETQPVLAPNSVKQETLPSDPSTTRTSESLRTSTAILTGSAVTVSSSNETEITLHQPITTNLSDSYDSSSASSSETEMGVQDDVGDILNVAEMLKKGTTQQTQKVSELQQGDEEPNGLVAEEYKGTLLLVMEGKEVPQGADSIGHTSGIVAIADVPGPFTTLSPCLHDKLEAEVTEILIGNASTAQADEANISFGEGAKQKTNSPLQVSHPDKHDEVQEVLSSYFKTETSKQTTSDDRSSGRKEDSELLKAKADMSKQSTSGSETTLIDVLVTSCTSPDNLKQKNDEEQELEIVKESIEKGLEEDKDQTPAEKNNDPANFTEEVESTEDTSSHKILPSAAAYNVVQEPLERNDLQKGTNEETRQVNLCCIDEAPPCSIQESASSNVDKQVERNAQEPLGDILQQQEREMSELGISDVMIQKNVVQALEQTDSNLSLESEQGQAPIVKEQQLHADIEQEYEPEELNKTTSGTVENERSIVNQELQSLTVEKESTTSIQGTMPVSPADIITEAQQESHASTLLNAASEAHETNEENYLVSQILERQEDVAVKLEAQSVVPEEAATSEKHNLLNAEQHILELVEPEMNATAIDTTNECQEKHDQIYIGSTYEEHTTNSLENEVEKVEVAQTEVEDLELKEKKKSQDEQPDQLDRGTVFEGHATNSAGSEMEKLECIELKVKITLVDQEECQEEKPDQAHSGSVCEEHKTTDNLENDMEKPDVGEPQVVSVTLDKDWKEKPGHSVHTRSLENAIEKLEGGKSEEAIVFEEEKEFEANPSQLVDIRKCAEKKPEVEELELESTSLEEKECREEMPDQVGSVCKEETNSVGNQLENELEVDNVAFHKEKESQEDELDQIEWGSACEGHATNSVEIEMDKLQVGEPEVKDISLDKEDYLQENTDHAHGVSVCQEYKITDSPENAMEKLDVGEPTVGSVTLHEDQKCKEDEPDQQLDRGIEGQVNSVISEMENLEVGQAEVKGIALDKDKCLQEKTDHADCGSICQEDKTTESLEYVMDKFDDGEPLVGGDEDHECQEEKFDRQLDGSTVCEEHATNSIEREMEKLAVRESEAELITLNKEECQEKKTEQAHSGSLCEEHKTKETLENVERLDSHVEDITLDRDQAYQEEKPDQVDGDTACQEHNKSKHSTRSVEEEIEQSKPEVESVALEEKQDSTEEIPGQVDSGCGSVDEEHDTHSTENQLEKPEVGEPEVEGVALHKEKESQEDELHQLERSIVCEGHAKLSVQSEMEEVEAEKPKVTLDKEECQEENHHETDLGSSCEEHQQTHFLEDAMKKPDVGEPQVGVMLDKHQELRRETSDQVDCDSICQEHPTSSMENEIEKLEVGESEKAITIEEEKECQGEHAATNFMRNEMEQPKPKVQSVTPEENKENPEEMPDPTDSGHAFKEHEMHSVKIELENPEVEEPEAEGVALQNEKEIREDELDHLTIWKRYAETCVDSEMEKIEGGKPEVALDKDECKEEKHYQADDGSLCEEHQQTAMEKPLMGEPQVEGIELDKDQESLEDKPDKVSGDSGSQEHPTSYSTENEIEKDEVRELEKAIALEEEKECPQEHTPKSEENEMEQPKPEVESATPHSPKEMQDHIDSGYVDEEHEMHSVENELEKPEVREAEIESVALYKKKDSQEDEPDQLERGIVCKEDAKDSIEIKTEKLEVRKPDLNSTALHKEECEEEKHHQADDGFVYEDHQVTDFLENALEEMPNVREPQVGALDKEEYEERDFLENALEKTNVGEPQVEGIMLDKDQELQEDIPDQVDSDSVSQEDTTISMKNEREKLEVGESEEAITIKEEKDFQEEHTTKSVDNELDQPKPEAETAALEEKKESPEEMPDQIDHGCGCEEYEMENELEKIEVGEAEVESNAVHGKKECHEQEFNHLERGPVCEGDATTFFESETEMLEVGKPEVASTTLKEECEEGKHDQADGGSVCEKHQVTDFLEHAMEKPDVEEPQVEGVTLDKDQELPEEKSDQVDSETVCQEHPTNSELEKLEVRESQIAIAVEENQEEHTINRVENGMQQPKPKVESTTLEEKKESPEQMPDQVDGSYVRKEHEMPSVANEFENPEMGEPEVESVALHKKKESQEDQLEQLERGAVCKERTENCVENEVGKPEVNNTALDKENCEEDQADSGSACEKHQVTDFLEHAMETPAVEVPQVEGATLDNDQELPEEKLDLVDNDSACKDNTTRAFESKIEKLEVGESEAAIGLYQEREYQEHPCQLNVCDKHSMSSAENTKEKPAVKELEVESAPLEREECQEETSDQVESDSVCNEHQTKSVEISKMEEPELGDVAPYQKNETKEGEVDEVSGSFPNEQLITDSVEKGLERLELDEAHVGLALEEKEVCQPDQAHHASSVCDERAAKSVASEELEEPEAGALIRDEMECQEDVAVHQKNESKEGEADEVSGSSPNEQLITDSGEKDLKRLEAGEAQVGLALEEMEDCQPKHANSEPGQVHSSSICEEKTTNLMINLEKPEMEEPQVDDVKLDKVKLGQEENPANVENSYQNTTSFLQGKTDNLEFDEPEGSDAALETVDCEKEPYQLHIEPVTEEHDINSPDNEMEKLEGREPEGSVKLDGENEDQEEKPADIKKVSQGQEQTTSCLEIKLEKLKAEDPEVTLKEVKDHQDDKPGQLDSGSACDEPEVGEQEVESAALQKKKECQEENTEQVEREPEAGAVMLDEIKGCYEDKPNQIGSHSECGQHPAIEHEMEKLEVGEPQEECPEKEECQEEDSDRLSSAFVCEEQATNIAETEKEKLEMGDPEVDNFLLNNEELQKEKSDRVRDRSENEQYITRSLENIEKLEVENSEIDEEKPGSVYEEQATDFVENETKKSEVGAPGVEVIKLEKKECESEKPDQIMGSSVSEEHATDLEDDDMDKLQVSQPELGGIVALDERKECVVREPQQVDDNRCLSEAQMVESVENEREKSEMGVPEVEDLPNEIERQSEEPDQSTSNSASEEYATNSKEDDMNKFEVDQPEVEKPDQLADSRSESEEHTADSVENETEKPEVIVPEVLHNKEGQSEKPDQARSNSICGEHAADSKENDMDKLELNQPEIGMPHQVTSSRSVGTANIADSVENGTEKPEMEVPELKDNVLDEKECHRDRPDPDEHSSVCGEHMTAYSREDHTDDLEVNQPKVEKPDEIIASTTSLSEAHTLDFLKKETEKSEVDVLEKEDNVLESHREKPDQDESSSVYEEHATDSKIDGEVNQPEVGEPDQVMAVGTSVNEIDTLDSLRNGTEKLEEGVPEVEGNVLEQKECHGEKPDQNESSSVLEEHATDFKEDGMEKPEEGMAKEEDNVLEQKECFGEKPDQDESSSVFEEHATDYKEDDTDKLEVNQPKVEEPHQVIASSTSESETHTLDSLRNETEKPEEGVLEVEDNALAPKECLGEKTEQDENSSVCEEHAADSKEDCMDKLEVNESEVEKPPQVIAGSTPVSETHILDSQENKTEKNEEGVPEVEDNVLEDKVGENPNLDESSYVREEPNLHESRYVREEHATDSKEDDMDKLEVNLPEPDQDNVLEEQECVGEKPDQYESSSVCEEHATDSKEDVDKLEVNLPEPDKVISDGTSLREHTLNSVENGTEEPEVGVPEVKDDGLACGTFSTPQEVTASSANDYLKTKDEEQETQPVNFPVALSPENREDKSNLLQTSIHDFSTEENVEVVPAEGKQEEEFEQASANSENACEQFLAAIDQKTKQASEDDPSSREEEWKIEVKDLPAMSKSEAEEIEFRQTTEMSDAPKPQEGTREIPEQLDTAKPEGAKQEPLHHLQSWKEGRETHPADEPVLSQETQKYEPNKVDAAIPLENTFKEANNVNLTTNGQEVEAKEIGTHTEQKGQCQGISLPTLALAELQAQQAIPVDEGLELSTIQSSPSDVKDTLLDIKEHKDGAQEQHSPQSVLEQQESPAEDDKSYRIQEVAATQYQVDNPEPLSDKDVETQDTDQTNSNEKQSGHNSECNITGLPMLATELGNQLNLVKQQHEAQKPKNLDVEAEDATDMKLACNQNIPILSDEGMKPEDRQQKQIDEAFESLHTPVMTCSTPCNLLLLPL